jgi:hypothetical protein
VRCIGIEGRLFDWLCNYIADRKIRVVINGQKSEWMKTTVGVPQGSILGPLLFLIFVDDVTKDIESNIHIFADDTSLMEIIENYNESYAKLNRDLTRLSLWANKWLITFNAAKTVYIQISRKVFPAPKPVLRLNGVIVKEVPTHKHLGLTFNQSLTWTDHINNLISKGAKCVGLLRRISRDVPRECLEILYKSMIRPILEYGDIIFDGCSDTSAKRLENVQRQAGLTCTGAFRHTRHTSLLEELGWPPLSQRRKHHRLNVMFKLLRGMAPNYLLNLCPPLTRDRTTYNLRTGQNVTMPQQKTSTYQNSFFPKSIKNWNELSIRDREVGTIQTFKEHQKKTSGFKVNILYHLYSSKSAINHTRIRLGLSGLASQRFDYKHIKDPICTRCNAKSESPAHYFLKCPSYAAHRPFFLREICLIFQNNNIEVDLAKPSFQKIFINTILRGSLLLDDLNNGTIFFLTQLYIQQTQRFP